MLCRPRFSRHALRAELAKSSRCAARLAIIRRVHPPRRAALACAPGMLRAVPAHCAAHRKSSTFAGMESWLGMLGMMGLQLLLLRAWGWAVE